MIPKRKRTSPLQFIALLLIFTVSFFAGKFIADWGIIGEPDDTGTAVVKQDGDKLPVKRLNVLLLGVDARPGEKDARTDSIILVSIDRDTKKIAMVSIPRDTLVDIPGHGQGKINSANVYGGADLARQTVEDLLDVEIPYYVKTNFEGFQEIVDTLGGVEIDVERRMYYPAENINLKPGMQKLDGFNALGYVRYRHDALGDIGRTERQQKFLSALAKEMLKARTILKAPVLIPKMMDAVDTNLGVKDAIFLARAVSNLESENIVTATLPGSFYNYKGASYWKIDDDKAKVVLNDLFSGLKVATITGPDINVPADVRPAKKPQPENETPDPVPGKDKAGPENPTGGQGLPGDGSQPGQKQDDQGSMSPVKPPGSGTVQPGTNPGGQPPGSQPPGGQNPGGQLPPGSQNPPAGNGQGGRTDPNTPPPSTGGQNEPADPGANTDPAAGEQDGNGITSDLKVDIISQG